MISFKDNNIYTSIPEKLDQEYFESIVKKDNIIIERIISSTDAQIILDPFMGSGTTAIAAKKLNRHFIGVELSSEYVDLSKKRLERALNILPLF